jgi:hypothetical protein
VRRSGDDAPDILFGAAVDEHALGVAGGEYATTVGGACLVQHGCALQRWFPQRDGVDMELLAAVVHPNHPSRIGVGAPAAIAGYGVVRHYWAPRAQNRTCGFPAYGSHLGWLTAKRSLGQG